MALARTNGLLILLAVGLGCQRGVTTERGGDAGREMGPTLFMGCKAGEEQEVAGIKLRWCPAGTFLKGVRLNQPVVAKLAAQLNTVF